VAYLEKLRSDKLRSCSIRIQKIVRGWLAKRRYDKICRAVTLLQTYGRGAIARRSDRAFTHYTFANMCLKHFKKFFSDKLCQF